SAIVTLKVFAAGLTGKFNFVGNVPPTGAWASITAGNVSGSHDFAYNATFSYNCGSSTDLNTSCCAPDPMVETRLNQIYALVQEIYSIIPVRVPNYAAGAAHAGLTGQGNISLDPTTIALKIEITQLPASYGVKDAFPDRYFGV